MRVLENLAGLSVSIFLSIHAFRWVINTYNLDYTMKSVAGWTYPLWVLRLAIFVGFSTAAYFYLDRTIKWVVSLVTHQEQVFPSHEGGLQ